jgi:hypothetical protein
VATTGAVLPHGARDADTDALVLDQLLDGDVPVGCALRSVLHGNEASLMKWLEKDYVSGDWYFRGVCLNPLIWLSVIGVLISCTRWVWFFLAIAIFAFIMGRIT